MVIPVVYIDVRTCEGNS